ncbi:MAG TPA: hypothetical protein VIV58_26760 [Kofleriaceae bacterium]
MTDAQLAAILSAITVVAGIIGAAIRWSAKRIIRALDANSDSNVKLTGKLAEFTLRLEDVVKFMDEYTPPPQEMPKPPKRRTPAYGVAVTEYSYSRAKSRSDGDE